MDTLLRTIINGTATSMPTSPHVQLQKRSPMNIAAPLMWPAFPMTAGFTSNPSRLKTAIGINAASAPTPRSWNWRKSKLIEDIAYADRAVEYPDAASVPASSYYRYSNRAGSSRVLSHSHSAETLCRVRLGQNMRDPGKESRTGGFMRNDNEKGAAGYIAAWALGVPFTLLLIIFLLRGCT